MGEKIKRTGRQRSLASRLDARLSRTQRKKRNYRQLWNVQINAGAKTAGTTYSKLISGLKKQNIVLDRKILAELAKTEPKVFEKIVEKAK